MTIYAGTNQQRTNLYREMLERWHRCRRQFPAIAHDNLFPKSEDYGLSDRESEAVQLAVRKEFER